MPTPPAARAVCGPAERRAARLTAGPPAATRSPAVAGLMTLVAAVRDLRLCDHPAPAAHPGRGAGTRPRTVACQEVEGGCYVTFAAGYAAVYQALVVVLIGVVLYAFLKARRERDGQVAEPGAGDSGTTQIGGAAR